MLRNLEREIGVSAMKPAATAASPRARDRKADTAGEGLHALYAELLGRDATSTERVQALERALRSPLGQQLRAEMGRFVVERLSVLVPEVYAQWRTLVQDAMFFVVLHLSPGRLAPKLVEQMELAPDTPPAARLLRLIAKVPGLQKIGQILARNRHLHPALRRALSQLENGISDVSADVIRAIIFARLGAQLEAHAVKLDDRILCEASVSAVLRFTWCDPGSRQRRRGVFKVLKPHIPAYYAEDMRFLQDLADFLGHNHGRYGVPARGIADTFGKVRRLLQHEVDFRGEQKTLLRASRVYGSLPGVRVPRVIQPLCASDITAITEERGRKITDAVPRMPVARRERVAAQLIDTLLAVPLFAPQARTMFHADPHAGNLLYDPRSGELVVLDWALTESLTGGQRRHLALLFFMMLLRDATGLCREIAALSQGRRRQAPTEVMRACVARFLDELPLTRVPGVVEAMRLLEQAAFAGVRFPAPLIMLSKVMFTLDGILHDLRAPKARPEFVLSWHLLRRWMGDLRSLGAPLTLGDWVGIERSALFWGSRLASQWARGALTRRSAAMAAA